MRVACSPIGFRYPSACYFPAPTAQICRLFSKLSPASLLIDLSPFPSRRFSGILFFLEISYTLFKYYIEIRVIFSRDILFHYFLPLELRKKIPMIFSNVLEFKESSTNLSSFWKTATNSSEDNSFPWCKSLKIFKKDTTLPFLINYSSEVDYFS